VVAILAQSLKPELKVTLVEADKRKAVFLREAARKLELSVTIEAERIERLAPLQANVVSARALAPLSQLCDLAHRHMAAGGVAILLKGKRSDAEIATARQKWAFELEVTDSITSAEASVLKLKELRPEALYHRKCEPEGWCWQNHNSDKSGSGFG
jgi:16S rRNA (guanine527-N7)-methyltransferase